VTGFLLRRAVVSVLVLFIVVTLTFFLVQLAPGGVSILMNPNLPVEEVARLERVLGLDRPVHEQYLRWLGNLVRGDLGGSLTYGGRPVLEMVLERIPATVYLGFAAFVLTVAIGIPVGVYAARHHNGVADQVVSFLSFLGLATPNFWLGILLIVVFAVQLRWLPASGIGPSGDEGDLIDRLRHLILPALVMASLSLAAVVRFTRSAWLEVVALDFVRTARSKGASQARIDRFHIFKNAMIPVVTIIGVQLPQILGGSAVVETLFSWPGLGRLAVDAALRRDTPLILGVTLVVAVFVVLSNLLVDLLYPVLDPRIRYS
jgi:peptide/nickel transport system permease protein